MLISEGHKVSAGEAVQKENIAPFSQSNTLGQEPPHSSIEAPRMTHPRTLPAVGNPYRNPRAYNPYRQNVDSYRTVGESREPTSISPHVSESINSVSPKTPGLGMVDFASTETCVDDEGETRCESAELTISDLTSRSGAGDSPEVGIDVQKIAVSGVVNSPTPPISRHSSVEPHGTSAREGPRGQMRIVAKWIALLKSRPICPQNRLDHQEHRRGILNRLRFNVQVLQV